MVTEECVCSSTHDNNKINNNTDTWILDSAATSHFIYNEQSLSNIKYLQTPRRIKTASGYIESSVVGDVRLYSEKGELVVLKRVLYVPTFTVNLISSRRFTDKDCTVTEYKDKAVVRKTEGDRENTILTAYTNNNLYVFQLYTHHAYNNTLENDKEQSSTANNKNINKVVIVKGNSN